MPAVLPGFKYLGGMEGGLGERGRLGCAHLWGAACHVLVGGERGVGALGGDLKREDGKDEDVGEGRRIKGPR